MKGLLKGFALLFSAVIIFGVFFIIGASLTQTLPRVVLFATGLSDWEYQSRPQTAVYYADGSQMTTLGYQRVYQEDFPDLLKKSVVAVEDKRFYQHAGLDARSIGRAIWKNIRAGSKAEGGSTITQQLARTLFLNQEKTYIRKIKEVFIATALEEKYGKDAILNMYLNEIYMGRGCSGMGCAARTYFNRDLSQLNQGQICMLAGMIQAPEFYAPERNYKGLKERQETVIDLLVEQGVVTAAEGEQIKAQSLDIQPYVPEGGRHPYLTVYIRKQVEEMLGSKGMYQAGLKIYTTIDRRMQEAAEKSVADQVKTLLARGINAHDMALVSIDPTSGAIKAFVGGPDFLQNQLDMAILPRQPGSSIKPLYYAAAIDQGLIDPEMMINNKPRDFGGNYKPRNHVANAPEEVSVRDALALSENVASVEIMNMLGVETASSYIRKFGVTTLKPEDQHLALALGGMNEGIPPVEMAAAYSVFADGGWYHEYYSIERIEDTTGKIIPNTKSSSESWRAISEDTAATMDELLQGVVNYGTGSGARIAVRSSGKTGTTEDSRDLWYIGYTGQLCTAIWAGNSSGAVVKGYDTFGGSVSAPVWRNYMNSLLYSGVFQGKTTPAVEEETPVEEPAPDETVDGEQATDTGDENDTSPVLEPPDDTVNQGETMTNTGTDKTTGSDIKNDDRKKTTIDPGNQVPVDVRNGAGY
ncbi:MAG: transglycosylase domain-containing protein [Deltaproteobacteria bacterium]